MGILTTFFGLSKPVGSDTFGSAITQYNGDMDLIDTALQNKLDKGSTAPYSGTAPTPDVVAMSATAAAGQTANILETRNSASAVLTAIGNRGQLVGVAKDQADIMAWMGM